MAEETDQLTRDALEDLKKFADDLYPKVEYYSKGKKAGKNGNKLKEYVKAKFPGTTDAPWDDETYKKIEQYSKKGPFHALQSVYAAGYEAITWKDDLSEDIKKNLNTVMPTKLLREYINNAVLPGFSHLQTVFDFNQNDINNNFIKGNSENYEARKDFHDSITKLDSIDSNTDGNFETDDVNWNDELIMNWKSEDFDVNETIIIPITKKNCPVIFSKELTAAASSFEDYYREWKKKPDGDEKNGIKLRHEDISDFPLYFISLCQNRKRRSHTEWHSVWSNANKESKKDIDDQGQNTEQAIGVPPVGSNEWKKKEWLEYQEELNADGETKKNKIPNIVKYDMNNDGNYQFTAFHANIVFLCGGILYSLGYGLDNDDVFKKNHPWLSFIETKLKEKGLVTGVDLFGTGTIYSRDGVDLETDSYNYKIVHIGILDKQMVFRINSLFATITQLNLQAFVLIKDEKETGLQFYEFSAETSLVYSRLSTNLVKGKYYNCSSFVHDITGGIVNCGFLYSDPNKCVSSLADFNSEKIKKIMDSYMDKEITLKDFTELVGYDPGCIVSTPPP